MDRVILSLLMVALSFGFLGGCGYKDKPQDPANKAFAEPQPPATISRPSRQVRDPATTQCGKGPMTLQRIHEASTANRTIAEQGLALQLRETAGIERNADPV